MKLFGKDMAKLLGEEPSNFLDQHWQYLRGFFNLSILRFFIAWFALVPAVLLFTSGLPEDLSVMIADKLYTLNLSLPVRWEILWVSSVIYILAYGLTSVFRPSFIKLYPTFSDYKAVGHAPRWVVWELYYALKKWDTEKLIGRLLTKKRLKEIGEDTPGKYALQDYDGSEPKISVLQNETLVAFSYKKKKYYFALGEGSEDIVDVEKDTFWEVFGHYARSRPRLRRTICWMIVISISLFCVAIIQNIWNGFVYMVS